MSNPISTDLAELVILLVEIKSHPNLHKDLTFMILIPPLISYKIFWENFFIN